MELVSLVWYISISIGSLVSSSVLNRTSLDVKERCQNMCKEGRKKRERVCMCVEKSEGNECVCVCVFRHHIKKSNMREKMKEIDR